MPDYSKPKMLTPAPVINFNLKFRLQLIKKAEDKLNYF